MTILSINYAVEPFGLALYQQGQCLESSLFKSSHRKTEQLNEDIETLLQRHQLSYSDLTGVGVCIGPGNYTSLRVSVSIVKTLSYVLNCPVIPLQTLYVLALPYRVFKQTICTVIPARKGEINAQLFTSDGVTVTPVSSFFSCSYAEFDQFLNQFKAPLYVAGVFPQDMRLCDNTHIQWIKSHVNPCEMSEEVMTQMGKGTTSSFKEIEIIYSHQPV